MDSTASPRFVHLRLHTEFSIEDGITRVDDVIAAAAADGQVALGISDLANLFGMVKHYKGCRGKGIKPVIGVDAWLTNDAERDKPHRILLLVRTPTGYRQLCELITRAYIENKLRGRAELRREWLDTTSASDLICLSGAQQGDIAAALAAGNQKAAEALAQDWAARFPGSFYIEIQRAGHPGGENILQQALHLAGELGLPVVATHPVQFLKREDFRAHEARVCIAQGYVLADPRRPKHFTEEQYFKSQAEMVELFADIPEALENAVEIARRCSLTVTLGKNFLPQFPTPDGMTLDDFLIREAHQGLEKRLVQLYPNPADRDRERPRYLERLKFETDTIIQMGFPGYFLIVADFIQWGKNNGVPIGPGRGSGAGSLVAYSLKITDLDPTAYALLFERFLNPERVSMPDFDIDFCQEKRYMVIDYVRDRYGHDAVSQIATFGTMASKAVVRDVGRVLDLPYGLCDRLSKAIPVVQNKPLGLEEAREAEPAINEMMTDSSDGESVTELWELALPLEGMTRGVGMHAGGVLIAPGKITDFCPIYLADGDDAVTVSQFDKDDVEQIGLVKFDFLGLRNLTIIDLALDYVQRLTGERPDLMGLGFEDPAAYQILKDANTTAIFQVESDGMKKLLKKLGPDRFEDIIAVLALYRPGPLGSGMVDDFILRKKGQQAIDYFHPDLKPCLEPTYGVIVYQEQVMQISQIIGGYTLGGADMLRRAMGKKKPEEMAKHRATIAEGAAKKGYDPQLAEHLFDLMTKFAEYGFNKSHTAAYAVVTYHTAWLKAHHCAAFMAATLSSDLDNTDTVKIFYEDTAANGIKILPPDVNHSNYRFEPTDAKTIRYGLGAVKGCGEPAVRGILAAREADGPFRDLFDFCARIDRRAANRRVVEALVRAGALDTIAPKAPDGSPHRAKLLATVGIAMEAAEQAAANAGQGGLFDLDDGGRSAIAPEYIDARPWNEKQRLTEEKTAIGFFLSGHPFNSSAAEVRRFVRTPLSRLEPRKDPQMMAGVVTGIRVKMGQRGKVAFVTIDDGSRARDITIYAEVLEASKGKINQDEVLIVEGKASPDDFAGEDALRIIAERLMTLGEARSRHARLLRIRIAEEVARKAGARAASERLLHLLEAYRATREDGGCPIRVSYRNGRAEGELPFGEGWRVRLDESLLEGLREWLAPESVDIVYG
ncbi:MAG: DNA polymerase III subunit alpha [Candidatus Dactylopiibacterium carminicum]|uniref:DNA polymerase III subunit alpha n=1 Tax=Candidatus Dactylopiibacterium carminicum TaxID=857335 RepID=A0A272EZP3_9RHOO|nr:DNA polymerase III subunit alpha [Candidatus Dactylopiibacterium carminicum]KAF7600478.1 DNA polymerase III subunit alpha [Candidatus Dactylopiibacterium carminicum]PAS95100.1 MAG: DNA polymerase III subunit alpha [Candidatus Dactylopiibacterium carminicum]PAS97792.1 MAG: DNA polymerase III subunit alpha [Candidatus Dactylopiibacterium carminicum]PAT00478.1 MAG: DNA polymerase III subunit alpha [Candidatus Dactylopiibacterium carminicum]